MQRHIMKARLIYWSYAVLLLLGIAGLVLLTGCCKYETFTSREGIAHFSFEHPSSYEPESVRIGSLLDDDITVTLHTQPTSLGSVLYHDAEIFVHVENTGDRHSNSEEAVEFTISWWNRMGLSYDVNFRLMERSSLNFAGIRGEQIVYSFASYPLEDVHMGMHLVNTPAIVRRVYFERDGQIWSIAVTSHESIADDVKADFEHILETFKFLD